MTESKMGDAGRFDDETVARVLRRAAELQHDSNVPVVRGEGLTARQLEEIALEAGIDAAFVRRALAEQASAASVAERSAIRGEVGTLEVVEVLEGEVGPDSTDRMLEEVQRAFADGGSITRTERSATWTGSRALSGSRLSSLVVAITARGGQTEIRITERLENLATALFGGLAVGGSAAAIGISGAIGMGELGSPLVFAAMALTAVSGLYGTARTLYRRSTRRRRLELQRLLGRLVEVTISDRGLPAITGAPDANPGPGTGRGDVGA
jgi:hypothetical protein